MPRRNIRGNNITQRFTKIRDNSKTNNNIIAHIHISLYIRAPYEREKLVDELYLLNLNIFYYCCVYITLH